MTDFGRRPVADIATEAKQDGIIVALTALHADAGALTAQATHTFVDTIAFDDTIVSYTAGLVDVSAYRDFLLLLTLTVIGSPTDIVIRVLFSDQDVGGWLYVIGPFGELRYESTAGTKAEAIPGKCLAPYMGVFVEATGTNAGDTFTLTVKAVLTR